ncbi:NAD-dependent epimerase/dehydratase family protein [Paenibacillus tyrfis]|uniref:NAD-dependent epimerase/dehydratase family protein n=1 Tax=Paenibacillus tyrfis TaxID=1501230 RepID=UPI000B59295A|nr:NAD(P)-dependent oxidoreductase [Paenibacillus tyrfis]
MSSSNKVLITGAAGNIGKAFRQYAKDAGAEYSFRLADRSSDALSAVAQTEDEIMTLDVADLDACQQACASVSTVIHLAADPSPDADFYSSLLENNIKGTYNVFRAAKDQGCRRVIFASSAQAVEAYPLDVQVHSGMPVRPKNLYGVSKCFGEALASYFADVEGLSSIVVRIANFVSDSDALHGASARDLSAYISPRDLGELLLRCIETPSIKFAVFPGISNNRYKRMDLSDAREQLKYNPIDDSFAILDGLRNYSR